MKKIVRLTESDLVRIVRKVITENKKILKEDYSISSPPIAITKYENRGNFNEIEVQTKSNTYYYKITYSEVFGSADGSDNYKVNIDKIRQNGNLLIVDRWISGGETDEIEIQFEDVKQLGFGKEIEKDTMLGKVFVKRF